VLRKAGSKSEEERKLVYIRKRVCRETRQRVVKECLLLLFVCGEAERVAP
jgi:hypothetical protein